MSRKHYQLEVWQNSIELVQAIYRLTAKFPAEERFGLTSQLRRAAVSVPSNIAEGAARGSKKEFLRFLHIARGSLSEIDTQLHIAVVLNFIHHDEKPEALINMTFAKLGGLIKSLQHD